MPLRVPSLSDQTYQGFLNEALARIPVHNPEWTNFNDSDPGVTLVQLFAFLADNFLYRSNRVPEVNRRKFLSLLGIPLQAATPACGIVTLNNDRGPLETMTLPTNLEVRAGEVPFRTTSALDVLPVDWRVYFKQQVVDPPPGLIELYNQLYLSFGHGGMPPIFSLFQTVPLNAPSSTGAPGGVNLVKDTVDGAIWIALLKRTADRERSVDDVRAAIQGKTINLALVPRLSDARPVLSPVRTTNGQSARPAPLRFDLPAGGSLLESENREPRYRQLDPRATDDPLIGPAIIQLTLPSADMLRLWDNIEPIEPGVGNLPPALDDTNLNERLVTWIRMRLDSGAAVEAGRSDFSLIWAGINATKVLQRAHVSSEPLPLGTGNPDQVVALAHAPVVAGSVELTVTTSSGSQKWSEIDDLLAAGAEVAVVDPRVPPGSASADPPGPDNVFVVNLESGELRFGDGMRGRRPSYNAVLRADYDYSVGRAGNVAAQAINTGPTLPPGFSVTNAVRTWGGSNSETPADGEKQIARYLQHRDRLVTVEDFDTITRRTPGVEIGRVDIVPAYNPDLGPNEPGDAPGAVTVMVIPKSDPAQPDAPRPDRLFLDAVCRYLDQRRLVTTEVFLRGPAYKGIWISLGIRVDPGFSVASVREDVRRAILTVLSPLPSSDAAALTALTLEPMPPRGWPRTTPVVRLHLQAIASRVAGVFLVNGALLAEDTDATALVSTEQVDMVGLQLPRVAGISVVAGDPVSLTELRDRTSGAGIAGPPMERVPLPLPVPIIPAECQ